MNTAELKKYLGMVFDLEKNIFLQQMLIKNINQKINGLSHSYSYKEPTKPNRSSNTSALGCGLFLLVIGLFGVFICIMCFVAETESIESALLLLCCLLICPGALWYGFLIVLKEFPEYNENKKTIENRYDSDLKKYQKEYNEYKLNLVKEEQRKREGPLKIAALQYDLKKIEEQHTKTHKLLKQIYDQGIIYPKYRNFAMVSLMYEYIYSGRCSSLEGTDGAYNILETELRLDRISVQLDQIISHLEKIKQNQFMLYSAIQESNSRLSQIMKATELINDNLLSFQGTVDELNAYIAEIWKNSEINAYCEERSQKELSYMHRAIFSPSYYDNVVFRKNYDI